VIGLIATVEMMTMLVGGGIETGNGKKRFMIHLSEKTKEHHVKPQSEQGEFRIRYFLTKLYKPTLK
jgi:hypothetical protein